MSRLAHSLEAIIIFHVVCIVLDGAIYLVSHNHVKYIYNNNRLIECNTIDISDAVTIFLTTARTPRYFRRFSHLPSFEYDVGSITL